jgi:DNA-binding GntR family transcriptional regulator
MTQVKFTSIADAVFEKLESDILTGVYKRGTILTENELSTQLEVSRTPIREAIRRLEQENLIKELSKGHEVIGITSADIMDIYDVRIAIEGKATRLCAERITDAEIDEMRDVIDLQEFYTLKNSADKIKGTDSRFHELIYKCSRSAIYESVLSSLHRKIQLCRKVSVSNTDRAEHAIKEHREIFNAIASRNLDLAEKLMVEHVINAKNNIKGLE